MKNILLYFGSFNPIHNGHVAIARWAAEHLAAVMDELWLVVSPQNPLRTDLAPEADRLAMARLAMEDADCEQGAVIKVCDVEFGLPKPSYTIDTLRFLRREHPDCRFAILAGGDIVDQLPQWREHEAILAEYHIYIYPRVREDGEGSAQAPQERHSEAELSEAVESAGEASLTILTNAPQLEFSSTEVRRELQNGQSVENMVPAKVAEYIETHGLWRPTTAAGWLQRGRRCQRLGNMSAALSDLLRAQEFDPTNTEIAQRIAMLREIFEYHYTDYYNP